jgi:ribosome-associated protein
MADEKTIEDIVNDWPHADIQRLRALRRNALKEREQQRPPRAFREIFKMLRELDGGNDKQRGKDTIGEFEVS